MRVASSTRYYNYLDKQVVSGLQGYSGSEILALFFQRFS